MVRCINLDNKNIYIVSLKFAPGLKKEFMTIGKHLKSKGINVYYIVNIKYTLIEGDFENVHYVNFREDPKGILMDTITFDLQKKFPLILNYQPDLVLFYNPHPLNPMISYFLKRKFPNVKLALYLHDPYKPNKSPYGKVRALYIALVEFIQSLTIRYMDFVISPSGYSSTLFKEKFPNFKGKNYIAPLLVQDQQIYKKKPKYFSMIGNAHAATGHDTFIDLVNFVSEKSLDFRFILISSSNISKWLKKLNRIAKNNILVINRSIIKDEEIYQVIKESFAVFRLDKELTQSGVIPVSYMLSTPVIVTDIPGLRQHVVHRKSGYIVPSNPYPEDLINAMDYVKSNFWSMSKYARKFYEQVFSESNFDKYYKWIFDAI